MNRVMAMASETWVDTRSVLLEHCATIKPSSLQWNAIEALAIAMGGTSPDRYTFCSTGRELLALTPQTQRAALGFSSSILLLRFRVYHKLLSLLEGWYPSGVRATDTYTGISAWGLIDTALTSSEVINNEVNRSVSQCVEICPFPKLLLSLMTLNRVLGSHLGSCDLTTIASRTAGLTGLLLQWSQYDAETAEDRGAASNAINSTCRWVLLGEVPMPRDLVPELLESGLVRCRQCFEEESLEYSKVLVMSLSSLLPAFFMNKRYS